MSIKIAAGIVEYADSASLDRCLQSLNLGTGGLDLAIVVHGRYATCPIESKPCITDDTTLVTQSQQFPVGTVVLKHIHSPISQIEMRNKYLQLAAAKGCDWVLVLDSEEYVAPNADWALFRKQLEFCASLQLPHQVFDVTFEGTPAERGPRPRLFYRPGSICYWKHHYWWILKEQNLCLKGVGDAGRVIEGIYILEDKSLRNTEYRNAMDAYVQWQSVNEH